MGNFYKVSEVAKIFEVKPITVRKWCQTGNISAKKFGKSWYIYKDELAEIMNSSKKNNNGNILVKKGYM
ncbi:MAG: helix-turn-helix domain-containing protein [Actinobacteria bacterium]|nr:helix-turn-helix domain-containing protein [Actinomycetota bacterium]MBM3709034.1 helix-turn-helix domain-containing protein [Actinomycetota bacterium]